MARKYAATAPASGYTIMVVDDQQEILSATKTFLENAGHKVLTAMSGNQALDLFRPGQIDLLIVDYFMPRMTGEELVEQIRKIDEDVQVLLQTGYAGEKPPIEMLRALDIQGYHDKTEGPQRLLIWIEVTLKAAAHLKKVRETERLKAELIANVSHELRTPLNIMLGYSEMLLEGDAETPLPTYAQDGLRHIHNHARNLRALIDNFLSFAKVQAAAMEVHPEPCLLADLREDMQHVVDFFLRDKDVAFEWDVPIDIPAVWADSQKLPLILRNLLSNAAKFTTEGVIRVSARLHEADRQVIIRVEDTGIGIAPEHHQKIFELFRQVDGSSTRRYNGMGVGLSLSRHLARLMRGELTVESQRGAGATFILTLNLPPDEVDLSVTPPVDHGVPSAV